MRLGNALVGLEPLASAGLGWDSEHSGECIQGCLVLPSVTYHHALSGGAKSGPAVSPLGVCPSLEGTAVEGVTLTFTWLLLSYCKHISAASQRETLKMPLNHSFLP